YHLNEEKDMTLNVGLGYRLRDATKFIVGMDYKQFRVGAAYDLTVSDLRDADGVPGGFELGASYIAKIYKKPDVKPVIFCPRF
ncbi:MAG: type IX secretion system membrane protein PorP/SprF, partial [Bacteroidota bacterium]